MDTRVRLFRADRWTDVQPNQSVQGPIRSLPSSCPGLHISPEIQLDSIRVVPALVKQWGTTNTITLTFLWESGISGSHLCFVSLKMYSYLSCDESPPSWLKVASFLPVAVLGPPDVTVSGCGNCLLVQLAVPARELQEDLQLRDLYRGVIFHVQRTRDGAQVGFCNL